MRRFAFKKFWKCISESNETESIHGMLHRCKEQELITIDEYRAISPKKFQTYYVARDETDKAKMKCWRIYLRNQLIGEFESSGKLTMPKFPMRFPFRFA